jgi:hypothetical protein
MRAARRLIALPAIDLGSRRSMLDPDAGQIDLQEATTVEHGA